MSTQPRRSGGGSSARRPANPSALSMRARPRPSSALRRWPASSRWVSKNTARSTGRSAPHGEQRRARIVAGCRRALRARRSRGSARAPRDAARPPAVARRPPAIRPDARGRPDAGRSRRGPRGCRRTAGPCPCASARAGLRAAPRACGRRRNCRRDIGGDTSWNPGVARPRLYTVGTETDHVEESAC